MVKDCAKTGFRSCLTSGHKKTRDQAARFRNALGWRLADQLETREEIRDFLSGCVWSV